MSIRKAITTTVLLIIICLGLKPADTFAAAYSWMAQADEYKLGRHLQGIESYDKEFLDDDDWKYTEKYYYLSLPVKMDVNFSFEVTGSNVPSLYVYNNKGICEKSWNSDDWDYNPKTFTSTLDVDCNLKKGMHYLEIDFSLNDGESVVWTLDTAGGVAVKPVVKSLKKKGRNRVKVTLNNLSGTSGCMLYMKTGSKGSYKLVKRLKGKSFTTKKLKRKKTYYFRCMTFVKIGSRKFYSPYSKVKKIKLK